GAGAAEQHLGVKNQLGGDLGRHLGEQVFQVLPEIGKPLAAVLENRLEGLLEAVFDVGGNALPKLLLLLHLIAQRGVGRSRLADSVKLLLGKLIVFFAGSCLGHIAGEQRILLFLRVASYRQLKVQQIRLFLKRRDLVVVADCLLIKVVLADAIRDILCIQVQFLGFGQILRFQRGGLSIGRISEGDFLGDQNFLRRRRDLVLHLGFVLRRRALRRGGGEIVQRCALVGIGLRFLRARLDRHRQIALSLFGQRLIGRGRLALEQVQRRRTRDIGFLAG